MTVGKFLEVYHDYFIIYDKNDHIVGSDVSTEKTLKKLYRRKIETIHTVNYTAEIYIK